MKDVPLSPTVLAFALLIISNCFMTLAWYGHLKFLHHAPLWQAILFGWIIALLEYSFMIPATRMLSAQGWLLGEMKITQEVVTLIVFVPFMLFCLNNHLNWIICGRWYVYLAVSTSYLEASKLQWLVN